MENPPVLVQHFLFVTSPLHGHMNPVRCLAARVAAANPSARVTFSTAVSGHRLMFPSLASPDEEVVDGVLLHVPYSDGFDEGFNPKVHDVRSYSTRARAVGCETLSGVVARLAARGCPVTRVVYTFLVGWALDVARVHGARAVLYWIQPATVFAVYYHYFHGHGAALASCANDPGRDASVQLPGLPPLKSKALPSIVSITSPEQPYYTALAALHDIFSALDEHRPKVLVNTFDALELDALRAVPQLELVAVGPVVRDEASSLSTNSFQRENAKEYMDWLDTKAARSVVYVSFGSILQLSKRQGLELQRGLKATSRPYLWARRGAEQEGQDADLDETNGGAGREQRMVVEWCDQVRVLSHPAVGCFITHCGWNSALESITRGVPVVAVPQWTDQPTVACLVEERAGVGVGVGVCTLVDGEGVVECAELQRCVETVMGDSDRAVDIRASVEQWREQAREAVAGGGMSESNLRVFAFGL